MFGPARVAAQIIYDRPLITPRKLIQIMVVRLVLLFKYGFGASVQILSLLEYLSDKFEEIHKLIKLFHESPSLHFWPIFCNNSGQHFRYLCRTQLIAHLSLFQHISESQQWNTFFLSEMICLLTLTRFNVCLLHFDQTTYHSAYMHHGFVSA